MTTTTVTKPAPRGARVRLAPRTRKLLLLAHIAAAGTWLGMDVVLGLLVIAATTGDGQGAAAALVGIGEFATWPLAAAGLLTLATGLLLGVGTKFGLVRYWWVAVKLVLNVVLVTLVLALLGPEAGRLAADARDVLGGSGSLPTLDNLAFPPIVSTTLVLLAMTLSVVKPWGRIGRRARP